MLLSSVAAETLAPGVEYTLYNAAGPNRVHVVSVDRSQSQYALEVGWPQHKRNFTARQTVPTIASLYDNPPDEDVLAATNGSFFASTPVIIGTAASQGEILQQPDSQNDTYFFGTSGEPAIVSQVGHQIGTLTFANGFTTPLGYYNRPNPPIHAVTAYTPEWDDSTGTALSTSLALEVILEDVSYPMRGDKEVSGIISAIQTGAASQDNLIPAGGMVLTAYGIPRSEVLTHAAVGDRLRMSFATSAPLYNNAAMAITGIGRILNNGSPDTTNWANRSDGFPTQRHPRTVLAWSATHHFLVVIDGRSSESVGMTFSEMASFLTGTLSATDAVNLDGGGSSTMVVDGTIRNTPSDGSPRPVANAVLLVHRPPPVSFPFEDPFASTGRLAGWDDKFTYNDVAAINPPAPGGDGYVVVVADPAGGVDTMRRGHPGDADYSVEAWIYADIRDDVAADGFERYALFARDSGTGALGLSSYGGGNCYALTIDSDDGEIRAGKYVNGTFTELVNASSWQVMASSWQRLRIDCYGSTIRFWINGFPLGEATDTTHTAGMAGIGYHEFFTTNANIIGTRADRFAMFEDSAPSYLRGDLDGDGDCDLDDYALFQTCLTGQTVSQHDVRCIGARLDGDLDVDDEDLSLFLACLSGANVPVPGSCEIFP